MGKLLHLVIETIKMEDYKRIKQGNDVADDLNTVMETGEESLGADSDGVDIKDVASAEYEESQPDKDDGSSFDSHPDNELVNFDLEDQTSMGT